MTSAKISKVTISNSNYIHVGLIVISVELVSCPDFSWALVTPLNRDQTWQESVAPGMSTPCVRNCGLRRVQTALFHHRGLTLAYSAFS